MLRAFYRPNPNQTFLVINRDQTRFVERHLQRSAQSHILRRATSRTRRGRWASRFPRRRCTFGPAGGPTTAGAAAAARVWRSRAAAATPGPVNPPPPPSPLQSLQGSPSQRHSGGSDDVSHLSVLPNPSDHLTTFHGRDRVAPYLPPSLLLSSLTPTPCGRRIALPLPPLWTDFR